MKGKQKKSLRVWASWLLITLVLFWGAMSMYAQAATFSQFDDLKNHWSEEAVKWVIDRGYMQGKSSTKFDPNGTLTRAEVAQILYNMAGNPKVDGYENPYRDVAENSWYKDSIVWMYKWNLASDLEKVEDEFKPNRPASRQEIAFMFWQYAMNFDTKNVKAKFKLDPKVLDQFIDKRLVGWGYIKAEIWAVQYGLMQGSGGKLTPLDTITRGQVAQVVKNYFDNRTPNVPTPGPGPDDSSSGGASSGGSISSGGGTSSGGTSSGGAIISGGDTSSDTSSDVSSDTSSDTSSSSSRIEPPEESKPGATSSTTSSTPSRPAPPAESKPAA